MVWLDQGLPSRIRHSAIPVTHLVVIAAVAALVAFFIIPRGSPLGMQEYRMEDSAYRPDAVLRATNILLGDPVVRRARSIYAGPFIPEFYPLLGISNPFPASNNILLGDPAIQERMLEVFKRETPDIAFLSYGIPGWFRYDRNNPFDTYIRTTYTNCARLQRGEFYVYTKIPCDE